MHILFNDWSRILSPRQVAQILSDLIFLQPVAATKFCWKFCYKDFYKISPVHTKRFVAAMCRRNMLLQLVAQFVPTIRPLSAFSRVFSVNLPQKYQESSEKDYKLSALSSLAFPN